MQALTFLKLQLSEKFFFSLDDMAQCIGKARWRAKLPLLSIASPSLFPSPKGGSLLSISSSYVFPRAKGARMLSISSSSAFPSAEVASPLCIADPTSFCDLVSMSSVTGDIRAWRSGACAVVPVPDFSNAISQPRMDEF